MKTLQTESTVSENTLRNKLEDICNQFKYNINDSQTRGELIESIKAGMEQLRSDGVVDDIYKFEVKSYTAPNNGLGISVNIEGGSSLECISITIG